MKKWFTTFSTHTNNRLPTPSKTQYDRLCLTHTSFCHTKLYSYVFSQLFLLVDIVTKSQWSFNIRIASVICKSSKSIQLSLSFSTNSVQICNANSPTFLVFRNSPLTTHVAFRFGSFRNQISIERPIERPIDHMCIRYDSSENSYVSLNCYVFTFLNTQWL